MLESAPSISAPIPVWLVPRSRYLTSVKYILRTTGLVLICIFLGLSVSRLYPNLQTPVPELSSLDKQSHIVAITQPLHKGLLPYPSHGDDDNPQITAKVATGLIDKLSDHWSALNSWRLSKTFLPDPSIPSSPDPDSSINETVTEASTALGIRPRIGKVTFATGNEASDDGVYSRAIRTHAAHNRAHGYEMTTLRHHVAGDADAVWSKPSYILAVLLRELARPEGERLQWLFWFDADTIILNPHVPLEVFLPPPEFGDVHVLLTWDMNGLNNGVFPLRVHPWSVRFMNAILAFPAYKPDVQLRFKDQSAMDEVMKMHEFQKHLARVPQRWFNAYQGEIDETLGPFQVRRGDLLVHFAGAGDRNTRMAMWLDRVEKHLPEWEVAYEYTSYATEVKTYWYEQGREIRKTSKNAEKVREALWPFIGRMSDNLKKYGEQLSTEERDAIEAKITVIGVLMVEKVTTDDVVRLELERKELTKMAENLTKHVEAVKKINLKEAGNVLYSAERILTESYGATGSDAENVVNELSKCIQDLSAMIAINTDEPDELKKSIGEVIEKQKQVEEKIEEGKKRTDSTKSDVDKKANEKTEEEKKKESEEAEKKQEEEKEKKKKEEEGEKKKKEEEEEKKKKEEEEKKKKEDEDEKREEEEAAKKKKEEEEADGPKSLLNRR